MSEKRVSVRLSATGGRQVRAELEGVGEAGSRGFGRLSREMEAANVRLAAFARRARVALVAAAGAAATAAGAMIRSGLQVVDGQAKLAASLGSTVESIQVLARAGDLAGVSMGQVEQATLQLTRRLAQAAAGTGPAVGALARLRLTAAELQRLPLDARIALIQERLAEMVPEAERAAVAAQLFGDRAALVFGRIDTATLRQAAEDVHDFGVVVSEQDAAQIERTNDALSRLGLIWRGLANQLAVAAAPALEAMANAMAALARRTGPLGVAIRGLFDNLGRLAAYAAGIAALMAGRFVAAKVAAAASVRGLAMSLVVLRGALLRLPLIGLVVAAGELIHAFGRLVRGAGGFGEALSLLGDLAAEVWERITLGAAAMGLRLMTGWAEIRADIAEALQGALEAVVGFANGALTTFQGALDAIKVLWGALPPAIGEHAFAAANALVAGVEAMLNAVGRRINGFLEGINAGLSALGVERRIALVGELRLGQLDNPFEGQAAEAGSRAREAFQAALLAEPVALPDLGFEESARNARAQAELLREVMGAVETAARGPLASWEALRAAMAAGLAETRDGVETITEAVEELDDAVDEVVESAGRAGGAGRGAGSALREAADTARDAWEATAEALRAARERSREIAQGLAQDITGPIREALKSGEFSWQSFAGAVSRIAQNLASRLIDLAFKPIETA
ncbi:MAG: phage tail tape measure protein, partial [Rhodobacteraceae bacterium]|nr:phage tail tape measure protein [Paracoccaceae bacterium]